MYIPPTPYTPPSLANPAEPRERVTFFYRLTLGESKAWAERAEARHRIEERAAARLALLDTIDALASAVERVEVQGDAARAAERMKAQIDAKRIDGLREILVQYEDVSDIDMHDPTAAAELLAGVVHGWRDKDGMHVWPTSVTDAAELLRALPRVALGELVTGVARGLYDEAEVGKSLRRRAS